MKIFTGTVPENPHNGEIDIFNNIRLATKQGYDEGQQSILSQCKDIDLNMAWLDYSNYLRRPNRIASEDKLFTRWLIEQFILEVKP